MDFERLIDSVRPHRFLFDMRDPGFKDTGLKNNRWELIGKELGVSGIEASQKFRTMKTKFRKLKRRYEENTRSGSSHTPPPAWKHYRSMDSLLRSREVPTEWTLSNLSPSARPSVSLTEDHPAHDSVSSLINNVTTPGKDSGVEETLANSETSSTTEITEDTTNTLGQERGET
ncbi:uncharacterized protein ISCGN_008351 [Ixodes scapularis]